MPNIDTDKLPFLCSFEESALIGRDVILSVGERCHRQRSFCCCSQSKIGKLFLHFLFRYINPTYSLRRRHYYTATYQMITIHNQLINLIIYRKNVLYSQPPIYFVILWDEYHTGCCHLYSFNLTWQSKIGKKRILVWRDRHTTVTSVAWHIPWQASTPRHVKLSSWQTSIF